MADQLQRYYGLLEVNSSSTAAEIREAYLDLVKVWHPDRFSGESARFRRKVDDKLKAINEAYEAVRSGSPAFQSSSRPSPDDPPAVNPDLTPVHFGGKWGFVNRDKQLIIEPRFENAFPFQEGLALVADRGRYGFIDASGQYAVYPEFLGARSFRNGLAGVILTVHWGFIDRTGQFAVTPYYEECGDFSEGVAPVKWRGRWGFVDTAGRFTIRPRFDGARSFEGGRAGVRFGDKWGEVDHQGRAYFETGEIMLDGPRS